MLPLRPDPTSDTMLSAIVFLSLSLYTPPFLPVIDAELAST